MSAVTMDVGNRIRSYRIKAGISQKGLAERLELSPTAVNQWEAGYKLPSLPNRLKVADILGIPYRELIDEFTGEDGGPVLVTDPTLLKLISIYSKMSPRRREAMLLVFLNVAAQREAPTEVPEQPARA